MIADNRCTNTTFADTNLWIIFALVSVCVIMIIVVAFSLHVVHLKRRNRGQWHRTIIGRQADYLLCAVNGVITKCWLHTVQNTGLHNTTAVLIRPNIIYTRICIHTNMGLRTYVYEYIYVYIHPRIRTYIIRYTYVRTYLIYPSGCTYIHIHTHTGNIT